MLFAKIETSYLQVEGVGRTKSEALTNALIEVIKQTKGVAIDTKRAYIKSVSELGVMVDGRGSHGVSISEESTQAITEATKGFIQNYSIVDSYKEGSDWVVRVRVAMKRYKAPGFNPNKRRKMAIIPFEYASTYSVYGSSVNGVRVSELFTQTLVTKLTQSRKFTILDRENSKYYEQEKNFITSGNSSKDELLKLAKRLGTDYLLIGKIRNYSIVNKIKKSNIGLPSTNKTICNYTVSYRILMMATQQIKWSETLSGSFKVNSNNNDEAIIDSMDRISSIILDSILNNIYPPMIISVTQNSVVVNQGGNSLQLGDEFVAYAMGERLVDPYTNEFLGYEEIKSGRVTITKVNPKVSYAKVVEGVVQKGMLLRKVKQSGVRSSRKTLQNSGGEAQTDVKITPGGGVVLPFD